MYEVITIGSALVDIFINSPELKIANHQGKQYLCELYGEKLSVDRLELHGGGAGHNTAIGFKRLGFATAVVAELGKDTLGQLVEQHLTTAGVSTQLLVREKAEQTGGSVILQGPDGNRTVLVHRGAAAQLDKSDLPIEVLSQAQWLHLSSVAGRLEVIQAVAGLASHYGVGLSWNPGQTELELLRSGQLPLHDLPVKIMVMNQEEWLSISRIHQTLLHHCPLVVVTNGNKGGVVYEQSKSQLFAAQVVNSDQVTDATGAGDAFCVGLVAGQLRQHSLAESLQWAVRNSAAVVKKVGATAGVLAQAQIEQSAS